MKNKYVIIGGVAGGASAAARLRRLDESAEIILFERGSYISFANCGLPYYIGGVISEKDKLLVQTPEGMKRRFNIDVRVDSEVTAINRETNEVEVRNLKSGETYNESYDKLVLSPGAEPIRPAIKGIDNPKIFTLRNIPDTYAIKDYADQKKPRSAVIVGGGFIGIEMAENLNLLGIEVAIVEAADHVIGPLDYEMAAIVHQHLRTKGVKLFLNDGVKSFEDNGASLKITLASGREINADMAVMGVGVRPETRLAKECGLETGGRGGISVNDRMQTSDPDIYAVGDAVEINDFFTGEKTLIPLAGPANKQGRIAADNICGYNERYQGTQGTSIIKVFDITVAFTGRNERLLKGTVNYEKSFTHPASHAGYYPGAIPMSMKLIFSKDDGKVLGSQIVGYDGVDKRIDVLATAIRAGMTVYDLEKLELAYAPPFSSAKDPVNLAGYTASNILKKDCEVFHWDEVDQIDRAKFSLIDVRTPDEYALGTIDGAVNIPVDDLRVRLSELPKDKPIYVFCQVGLRGYLAARILKQNGFEKVKNLSGGYKTWLAAVENPDEKDVNETDTMTRGGDLRQIEPATEKPTNRIKLDACGLQCPGPILKVYNTIRDMSEGDTLEVSATDPGFIPDIKTWCKTTGNRLINSGFEGNAFKAVIKKEQQLNGKPAQAVEKSHDKSMIVFSNDLDKAIASFIIANGAAAMGRKVTMFFTFWGLNILRRPKKADVKKDFISNMFGFMMPRGSHKLSLSKMNMAGMGPKMIRYLMHKKEILSLEELIEQAQKNGIRFVACNMSMDIMGIKKEELIDGVEIGGVASFLGSAEESDMSLFI